MRSVSLRSMVLAAAVTCGCATGTQLDTTGSGGSGAAGAGTPTTVSQGGSGGEGAGTATGSGLAGGGGEGAGGSGAGGNGGEGGQGGGGTGGTGGQTTTTTGTGASGGGSTGHDCGDGTIDDDEECDQDNLGGQTCESLGFVGGTLSCSGACKLDTSECTKCGNGSVEPQLGEECDFDAMGDPLVLTTCQGLGFTGTSANPGCDATCHYDTGPCLCGNGTVDAGEGCDGADFDGKTCQSFGFTGGTLACSPQCEILATGCSQSTCGNGVVDAGEACDGANLNGKTCVTQGFTGGTLACSPACQLDTSGCTSPVCGNGLLEAGEQCDDGNTMSGDGCSATCQSEAMVCDPDGTYLIVQGGPISYSCCSGLVSVNVSSFVFQQDGATVLASPSNPAPMSGAATTCPAGSFSNTGSIPGGCTEIYSVSGSFTGPNTWSGLFEISFVGQDCSCFGGIFGTPCIGQVFPVTAMK